jgi:hypothetical protein
VPTVCPARAGARCGGGADRAGWEEAAARLVMNERDYRELLAGIAAHDPLADF